MTDRFVKVLENGRMNSRGLANLDGQVMAFVSKDETLTFTFEWADWLGSNTIASTVNEINGPTVGSITTNGTQTSFNVSNNPGMIRHRITDSAGQTKEVRMRVVSPDSQPYSDYGVCW